MDYGSSFNTNNSFTEGTFLSSEYLNPLYLFDKGYAFFQNFFSVIFSEQVVGIFYLIIAALAIFFLTIISYSIVRIFEIRKKEHAHLKHEIAEYAHRQKEREAKMLSDKEVSENEKWVQTLKYLFSESAGDWKLAIIEADAMLFDLMGQLGFKGDTLGDRLKNTDQDKFRNLPLAWEVHTIRNRIAHEGLSYAVSHHEAKRVVALYEKIFRQFGYI